MSRIFRPRDEKSLSYFFLELYCKKFVFSTLRTNNQIFFLQQKVWLLVWRVDKLFNNKIIKMFRNGTLLKKNRKKIK